MVQASSFGALALALAGLAAAIPAPDGSGAGAIPTPTGPSNIVNLILPNITERPLFASFVTANAAAATYNLACPKELEQLACEAGKFIGIAQGPSTWGFTMKTGTLTQTLDCALSAGNGQCTGWALRGSETTTFTTALPTYATMEAPVTVTAGLEKLQASSTSSGGGVPRMTQNAALFGVAAVVGGAMLY
ncbi:hypothetical protein B0H63DRAFT_557244 [Podospora didyma]|uniref:Uncharacterized protein n=1 Tax=Podospora didyma TaxID=330526 RepID=A0AAE0NZ39_9PEZI|nr:hypothetical protein B0H63DRAFT_557244 [Podospora didyma]